MLTAREKIEELFRNYAKEKLVCSLIFSDTKSSIDEKNQEIQFDNKLFLALLFLALRINILNVVDETDNEQLKMFKSEDTIFTEVYKKWQK